jgi:hypothetical protein
VSYLDDLGTELSAIGIRGRLHARILAEFADHLSTDPDAQLGAPAALAAQFADELGTSRARRAASAAFAALAVTGTVFGIAFLTAGPAGVDWPRAHPRSALLADLAAVVAVLAPQVAFVTGGLGALGAFRRRGDRAFSRNQAAVLLRRAAVGVVAGLATMVALALLAIEFSHGVSAAWTTFVFLGSAVSAAALVGAVPAVIAGMRLQPSMEGAHADLFDDLGPFVPPVLCRHPWWFALCTAGALAAAVALLGVVQSDGYDGVLRGLAEAVAILAGFAALGRKLGLR